MQLEDTQGRPLNELGKVFCPGSAQALRQLSRDLQGRYTDENTAILVTPSQRKWLTDQGYGVTFHGMEIVVSE